MMLKTGEAIPEGTLVYVNAVDQLMMLQEPCFRPYEGLQMKEAVESILNVFALGDPKDITEIARRNARRREVIRLHGEQRREWIAARCQRRRAWAGYSTDYSPEEFDAIMYIQPRARGADQR